MPRYSLKVLVASDLSARSDRPVERAILLSDQLDASVIVLHVASCQGQPNLKEEQRIRDQIEHDFDLSGIDAEFAIQYGHVPDVIANAANERGCALIVMGFPRFNRLRDYFRGNAVADLVGRSPAPVLVVKRRARRQYERLLVTADFSECSSEALRAAAALFPKGELRVVNSFQTAWGAFLDRESTIDLIREESVRLMTQLIDCLPATVRSRLQAQIHEGHLGQVILSQIRAWHADVLVIGTRAKRGLDYPTMGRTAAALLESAECDVLVVRKVTE